MSINVEDRPIESVREEVIDTLIYNYSHGHINEEAFERRLDIAMESKDPQKIIAQSADLQAPDKAPDNLKKPQSNTVQYEPSDYGDSENIVNIFGGSEHKGPWRVPETINALCMFGGADIDMTQATFTAKHTTIKVFCMFGGMEINVPEGLQVSTSTICIFGGAANKVRVPPNPDGPILRVEGFVMFGGVDIKIKHTMKEKFVAFANQMKTMFHTK
jgi:hypothetical protein